MSSSKCFLILRHVLLVAVVAAIGACSFKKNPVKASSETVIIQNYDQMATEPQELLLSLSEDKFIEVIDSKNIDYLEAIRGKQGETLLDLSIKFRKRKVLAHLLERNFNPLLYGKASMEDLAISEDYRSMLSGFQKPRFERLGEHIGKLIESGDLDNELQRMGFRATSCKDFLALVLESRYRTQPLLTEYQSSFVTDASSEVVVSALSKVSVCQGFKDQVSSAELREWLNSELLFQRNDNFKSRVLTEILLGFGKVENLAVEVPFRGRKVRLNPISVLAYDWDFSQRKDEFGRWKALLAPHLSRIVGYYNDGYFPNDGQSDGHKNWLDILFGREEVRGINSTEGEDHVSK